MSNLLIIILLTVIGFCGCIIVATCVFFLVYYKLKTQSQSSTPKPLNTSESQNKLQQSPSNNTTNNKEKSLSFNKMDHKDIAHMLMNPQIDKDTTQSDGNNSLVTASDTEYIKSFRTTTSSSNNNNTFHQSFMNLNNKESHIWGGNKNIKDDKNIKIKKQGKLHEIQPENISFECMIGKGKSAKVFKGVWKSRTVAVKWFRQSEIDEDSFTKDFTQELQIANNLEYNSNILKIYGYTSKPYAVVTEYLNGKSVEITVSLKHKDSMRSTLKLNDIITMLYDAANGIGHLHNNGIVHRDIAARNLICHYNKNYIRKVVVCDFGLSRITQSIHESNYTTSTIGPIKWMSPESIERQRFSSQTDIYSFGITMWETLTGVPPYSTIKVINVAIQVLHQKIRPIILPWFPFTLSLLMQRCWQSEPTYRPTMKQIIYELKTFKDYLDNHNNNNNNNNHDINDNINKLYTMNDDELKDSAFKLKTLSELINECDNMVFKSEFDKNYYYNIAKPDMLDKLNINNGNTNNNDHINELNNDKIEEKNNDNNLNNSKLMIHSYDDDESLKESDSDPPIKFVNGDSIPIKGNTNENNDENSKDGDKPGDINKLDLQFGASISIKVGGNKDTIEESKSVAIDINSIENQEKIIPPPKNREYNELELPSRNNSVLVSNEKRDTTKSIQL